MVGARSERSHNPIALPDLKVNVRFYAFFPPYSYLFQHESESWRFGHVDAVRLPREVDHLLSGVSPHHGERHADHLADLVQHEALALDSDHGELDVLLHERLAHRELGDETLRRRLKRKSEVKTIAL